MGYKIELDDYGQLQRVVATNKDLLRKNKMLRKSLNSSIETFKELNKFANSHLSGNCPVSELKAILKGFDE